MKADPSPKSRAIARSAVSPANAAVASRETQLALRGLVRSVDKGADEAGMQTSVNEASLRAQAPRHLAGHGGEVL